MDYAWVRRKINTIGVWYLVTFIGKIIKNYIEFSDVDKKQHAVGNMKQAAFGGEISDASATVKVDAILMIIRAQKVVEALEIIIKETSPNKVPPNTIEKATSILEEIKRGTIELPV